jgi:hypothetical protein
VRSAAHALSDVHAAQQAVAELKKELEEKRVMAQSLYEKKLTSGNQSNLVINFLL